MIPCHPRTGPKLGRVQSIGRLGLQTLFLHFLIQQFIERILTGNIIK